MLSESNRGQISVPVQKKRKGGLSIIFGETVVHRQEYVSIIPSPRRNWRCRCSAFKSGFLGRFVPSRSGSRYNDLQVIYSVNKPKQKDVLRLDVPVEFIASLTDTSQVKQEKRKPTPRRSQLNTPASDVVIQPFPVKQKKKVRFAEEVTIHNISACNYSPSAKPETFKLIVALQCIWATLDEDEDGYLNLEEFSYFVSEVWENEDSKGMLKSYTKNPEKGMDFDEWCTLLKEEDPTLHGFVDELFEIFVEVSDDSDDEEEKIMN